MKEKKKMEGKEERIKKKKDSLDLSGRGLSHFEEDFLQI